MKRFRIFLKDRFHVERAYYFLGCLTDEETDLYNHIQEAGFILVFREHSSTMIGKKKGNVDTDIVFDIFQELTKNYGQTIIAVTHDDDFAHKSDRIIEMKDGEIIKK